MTEKEKKKEKEVKAIVLPEETEGDVARFEKHTFTKEEMEDFQKKLARTIVDLRSKQSEKSAIVSQLTADIKKLEGETEGLAAKVVTGYEHRMMTCKITFYWSRGEKEIYHPETGELLQTDNISDGERQQQIDLSEKK